ncbi:MAG: class I SAM-dependent methyltransferase [Candidatus Acidiferrales bacterium]
MDNTLHNKAIVEQFTNQAVPFSLRHRQEDALNLMLRLSRVGASDTVLDVACGPGIVACAFAAVARHVTGIDITPAMLDRARSLQQENGLRNLAWECGDVATLPFPDDSFSIVVTRYSFHHFLSPAEVLREMARVCRPSGRVMVVDVSPAAEKLSAYDHFEKLRDPSHVHAFSPEDLRAFMAAAGLNQIESASYSLDMELEQQLAASFPNPGDADRVRELFRNDLGRDCLGVGAHLEGNEIRFAYPTTVIVATQPS